MSAFDGPQQERSTRPTESGVPNFEGGGPNEGTKVDYERGAPGQPLISNEVMKESQVGSGKSDSGGEYDEFGDNTRYASMTAASEGNLGDSRDIGSSSEEGLPLIGSIESKHMREQRMNGGEELQGDLNDLPRKNDAERQRPGLSPPRGKSSQDEFKGDELDRVQGSSNIAGDRDTEEFQSSKMTGSSTSGLASTGSYQRNELPISTIRNRDDRNDKMAQLTRP